MPKPPLTPRNITAAAVRKQIRLELAACLRSHRERDGVIRNEDALHEIACLTQALKLLRNAK